MIDVRPIGDDAEVFARELAEHLDPASAQAVLQIAQTAQGELSQAVMELLTKDPTGALSRSFEVSFEDTGDGFSAGAFTRSPYGQIQNEGGTVHAKKKYLAIPTDGVPRGMRPREYGAKLIFLKSKRGGGVLAEDMGNGQLKVRFILKPEVTIDGANYVGRALTQLEPQMDEIADARLGLVVRQAEQEAR